MSCALKALYSRDIYTPFIAIICLTVKRVMGIAFCRDHCLPEPKVEQSCPTPLRQSPQY